MAKAEKRLKELDNLFAKLYDNRACGNISARNYLILATKYQDGQIKLETDVMMFVNFWRMRTKQKEILKVREKQWISFPIFVSRIKD